MSTGYLGYKGCKGLLERLISLLRGALGDKLLALALFGSVARGKATKESDIDLLVLFKGDKREVEEVFLRAIMDLRRNHEYQSLVKEGYLPDPFPIYMDEQQLKSHPWVLLDVMDHGIILLDRGKVLRKELKLLKKRLKELGSRKVVLEDGSWYWELKPDWKPGEIIEI